MIKKIGFFVSVVLLSAGLIIVGLALQKPDVFHIERTLSIKASPDKIFPLINDLQNWKSWSPWEGLDPAMKRTFSGAASGVGAVYEWDGNRNIGSGRMEIVEELPPSIIVFKLEFFKPFKATNKAGFTLTQDGENTNVTWAMSGPQPFLSKVIGVFMNCDKMVGSQFEKGLSNLKSAVEAPAGQSPVLV